MQKQVISRKAVLNSLWHGTSQKYYQSIKNKGLLIATTPKKGASALIKERHYDSLAVICLTDHPQNARFYTAILNAGKQDDFLIVEIDKLALKNDLLIRRKKSRGEGKRLIKGAEYDYYENIPTYAIKNFYVWDDKLKDFSRSNKRR